MAEFPVQVIKQNKGLSDSDYLSKYGNTEKGGLNIDIGCGKAKANGFVGVDLRSLPGVDIVHDFNITPWPFDDETADLIVTSHVVEHVNCVVTFMSEIHRILKKNGHLVIRYPHFSQRHTFRDFTHKRFMTLESLDYFIFGSYLFGEYSNFGFEFINKTLHIDNDLGYLIAKINHNTYEKYWCKLLPAWQVILELKKIK
jgi:SAM-dependent methyltransferase